MPDDTSEERDSILHDVTEILREHLALDAWGRVLITMARDQEGELRVADVQVEEIIGDEARVERAFGAREAGAIMQALGKAIEALCLLEGVDVEDVHGGTFLRTDFEGGPPRVAFLPGLVRVPSPTYERPADERMVQLRKRELAEREKYALDEGNAMVLDPEHGAAEVTREGTCVARGNLVLIGTYARRYRQWVWGSHNESVSPDSRKRVRDALDAIPERDAWEISTPAFATDEHTAVGLAGWIALHAGWTTWIRDVEEGLYVYGVFDLAPV